MTTSCTIYYEVDNFRNSIEHDLIDNCIVTTIGFILEAIKLNHGVVKIKTILFTDYEEVIH